MCSRMHVEDHRRTHSIFATSSYLTNTGPPMSITNHLSYSERRQARAGIPKRNPTPAVVDALHRSANSGVNLFSSGNLLSGANIHTLSAATAPTTNAIKPGSRINNLYVHGNGDGHGER